MSKSYTTEILSVGTELLLGHVTNTDARDVSEQLSKIGLNVRYHTVVGDNPERLRQCVAIARERADVILTTGGLGPTCDDLTKQVLAECFDLPLVEDAAERAGLYDYIHYSRRFTDNNFVQALIPQGATVFHNSCGTAPGCAFEKDGKVVVMLPGPPKECRTMLRESAVPYLRRLGDGEIVSHAIRIFGIGESTVDEMFREEMNRLTNPTMAPYAKECDCLVQLTAKAATRQEAEEMLLPLRREVRERLGDYVFGEDVESLEETVYQLLCASPCRFALAEGFTGGDVARRFTELPGAGAFLRGCAVCPTPEAGTALLGLDRDFIIHHGAASRPVTEEMAKAVRVRMDAELALAVTGLDGSEEDATQEAGTVFAALADSRQVYVRQLSLGPHRSRSFIRQMAGNHVYDMLRRYLTGLPV